MYPKASCPDLKKVVLLLFLFHLFASLSFAQETLKPLKIAVKEFPPFIFKDLKGFSIDMARHICARNGLNPEFIYYETVKDVLDAVQNGTCDINFSGTTITAEREKYVDFSHPFFDSGLIVAIRANPDNRLLELTLTILKVIGLSLVVFLIGLSVVAHLIWFLEMQDNGAYRKLYDKWF